MRLPCVHADGTGAATPLLDRPQHGAQDDRAKVPQARCLRGMILLSSSGCGRTQSRDTAASSSGFPSSVTSCGHMGLSAMTVQVPMSHSLGWQVGAHVQEGH
jgi:hypothetical protein